MKLSTTISAVLVGLLSINLSHANDVQISNVDLGSFDTINGVQELSLDIAWSNSWRTSTLESNYDAVWVFAKFKIAGSSLWQHATLSLPVLPQAAGAELKVPMDGLGAFVQRDSPGIGDVSFSGVQLLWNRTADGILPSQLADICVLGVEMVYVPGGPFDVGDGSSQPAGNLASQDSTPRLIDSEGAFTLGGAATGSMISINTAVQSVTDDFNQTNSVTLPATYPKGFDPFYQMKYEIDMGLYVEFLNKLDSTQSATRAPVSNSFGNTIISNNGMVGSYSTATPSRACNFLRWSDMIALADWSGLRPMSELEFEKACRGDLSAVPNELSSGTPLASFNTYTIVNPGAADEMLVNADENAANLVFVFTTNEGRPLRTGISAASVLAPNRINTGGTRYGAMEMSGNLWEMVVSVGSSEGRAFQAVHGDGSLSNQGDADVSQWPDNTGQGGGIRGGGVFSSLDKLTVSARFFANFIVTSGDPDIGARLVRSSF